MTSPFKQGEYSRFSTFTLVFFARRDSSCSSSSYNALSLATILGNVAIPAFNSFTRRSISSSAEFTSSVSLSRDFLLLLCSGCAAGDGSGAIPLAWSNPNAKSNNLKNGYCEQPT
jgi:hypothetical protein